MAYDDAIVVFEDSGYVNLLPLVYWRPVFELRCGCMTLLERICAVQGIGEPVVYVRDYLSAVTAQEQVGQVRCERGQPGRTLFVNGRCLLFNSIREVEGNVVARAKDGGGDIAYVWADAELASRLTCDNFLQEGGLDGPLQGVQEIECDIELMRYPWDLVQQNITALLWDWGHGQDKGRQGKVYAGAHVLAEENVSMGRGSVVKPGTVLDAEEGPIMIGEDVIVKPNCTLEGPLYIGPGSLIQPGAAISEGVSIGPVCKVGGELESSIFHSYSNKQHDGFLGHSYVGQWVNLAADTVNSDLKNTYGPVRVPINGREVDTGCMFAGLIMGDHSKTSVDTMFSTGSVVGFGCSVFSSRFVPRFLRSFSWLTDDGIVEAVLEKTLATAEKVMVRRQVTMSQARKELFLEIFELAKRYESTNN